MCGSRAFTICTFAGSRLRHMYAPATATLLSGAAPSHTARHVWLGPATESLRRTRTLVTSESISRLPEVAALRAGDVFVWVGTPGSDLVPWAALRARRLRTVLYQTEPLTRGLCRHRAGEVWDYSRANLDAPCRRRATVTRRWVPPGATQNLSWPTPAARQAPGSSLAPDLAPRVVFLGQPGSGRRLRCVASLRDELGHDRVVWARDAWSDAALRDLVSSNPPTEAVVSPRVPRTHTRDLTLAENPVWPEPSLSTPTAARTQFVSLHKACNATTSTAAPAAEAFRFSQLLSLGALVLSERSAAVDEAAYSELVTFAPFVSLGAVVRELQHLGAGGRLALARQRAAAFAERFEPSQIFSRAGVWANKAY